MSSQRFIAAFKASPKVQGTDGDGYSRTGTNFV
jgi:hypothetical protein